MNRLRGTIIVLEIFEDPARVFRGTLRIGPMDSSMICMQAEPV